MNTFDQNVPRQDSAINGKRIRQRQKFHLLTEQGQGNLGYDKNRFFSSESGLYRSFWQYSKLFIQINSNWMRAHTQQTITIKLIRIVLIAKLRNYITVQHFFAFRPEGNRYLDNYTVWPSAWARSSNSWQELWLVF
jgi:hypothetical protein